METKTSTCFNRRSSEVNVVYLWFISLWGMFLNEEENPSWARGGDHSSVVDYWLQGSTLLGPRGPIPQDLAVGP